MNTFFLDITGQQDRASREAPTRHAALTIVSNAFATPFYTDAVIHEVNEESTVVSTITIEKRHRHFPFKREHTYIREQF